MRKILFVATLMLIMISTAWGQATNWNIYARATADWFAGQESLRNIPLQWMRAVDPMIASAGGDVGTGTYCYVDANVDNAGDASSWSNAVATLDEAIDVADGNDIIKIAANSTFTMGAAADEVDIDVDNLTIEGIGQGLSRPVFDYTGDVSSAFSIGADNITLINLRFHANILDVNDAVVLEAGSTNITFINCIFDVETPGTDEFHEAINSDAAGNHRLTVIGCEFAMGAGAARCAIEFQDSDYAVIAYNKFAGDYAVADINNVTTASDHITITDNEITNGTIGGAAGLNALPCITLVATTSGIVSDNIFVCNAATPDAAVVGADMWIFRNYYSETEGGVPAAPSWFASDTVENIIGVNDNSNLGVTSSVTADSDGSIVERLEQIDVDTSAISAGQSGATLIAGKSYTMTAATASITTATAPLFTIANGPIKITDFYGIASGSIGNSNMLIQSVGTVGPTTFPYTTDVALDADATGTTYTFSAAVPSVLVPLVGAQNLANRGASLNWYAPIGTVDQKGDADVSGIINWYMTFIPLVEGVTVVDAT